MEDINSLSVAELKKRIKEKKTNLIKSNPLDKFTNIDELLKENQLALRDLIEEQHITNKILLALYIQEASDGSLVAKPIAGIDTSAILEGLKGGGDDYQTLNPIMHNIDGKDANIRITGSGIIDTIKLVSNTTTTDNKDYSIEFNCDRNILYKTTFADLESRAGTERGMVCYEDIFAFKYLLIFRTILYIKGFEIKVYDSKAKFESFQVKYHKKV